MSKPALKDERARLDSALSDAKRILESAVAAVQDAERGLLAAATGDGKTVVSAERTLREAEAARDSVRRRVALLEEDAHRLDQEVAAVARIEAAAALRELRGKLAVRFQAAEDRLVQSVAELVAAVADLNFCSRRDASAASQLNDLSATPEETESPIYGGWQGLPPHPHGANAVARGVEIARERLGASAANGSVTFHLPILPPAE